MTHSTFPVLCHHVQTGGTSVQRMSLLLLWLTWHTERGLLADNHRAVVALPPLSLAPVTVRVLPLYSGDGVAVTRGQVPGVWTRVAPEPPVAPHKAGVWPHCALQQHILSNVDVWTRRPHRHADLQSLCRKTRTPSQGCFTCLCPAYCRFVCMRPVHTYWLCQYLQTSQLGEQTQLHLKYRHIHINISPYVLVLAQLVPAIPEAVWVRYV